LTVFPAKAWFRDTPWEKLIKTVLRVIHKNRVTAAKSFEDGK